MRNLQEATERICELKGSLLALEALAWSLAAAQEPRARGAVRLELARHAEAARNALLHLSISENTLTAFDEDMARHTARAARWPDASTTVEPLLLGVTPVHTFAAGRPLGSASGFLFAREDGRFLVTDRRVLEGADAGHRPDGIGLDLHVDAAHLPSVARVDLSLADARGRAWRHARTADGTAADIAVVRLPPQALPSAAHVSWFGPEHVGTGPGGSVEVGEALAIVGFPLGGFDTVHRLPVLRQATLATSLRVGFQGLPAFLTDARTGPGMSGAPVVVRWPGSGGRAIPYRLLGVHASRAEPGERGSHGDRSSGLDTAWSAALLAELTDPDLWPASDAVAPGGAT